MIWTCLQKKRRAPTKNPFRLQLERKTKEGQAKDDLENTIEDSLKAYKVTNVTTLDRNKWKITLNNTFIGQGNLLLSWNF